MGNYFEGFDFRNFWEDSDYAKKEYIEAAPSDELIASGFSTGGYACGFVEEWLKSRKKTGVIFTRLGKLWMSDAAEEALREQLD